MPAEPADRSNLDPDAIAGHAFTRARKGYEADEVRAFLVNLGSRVRGAQQKSADMERRLAELERRAVDPRDLDEAAVTELVGEETGRVLESARKASAEIREKATLQAAATTEAADTEAAATRSAADQYADGTRTAADEQAASIRSEADTYDAEVRELADNETRAQRETADTYAREVRAAADTEVAELRSTVGAELDRLRSEAESVLSDRTAEAEVASGSIRSDADAYSVRVRDDADRYVETTRTAADSYRADVQGGADAYRESATAEADRLRTDAQADADAVRTAADRAATERREALEVEVETILGEAREEGRGMVQEARTYRERVIADLADRRRAARTQLEDLAGTRDELAVALTDVASRIEASHRSLQEAVIDPRVIGEISQDRRVLEADDNPATSVGVGEIDSPLAEPAAAPEVDDAAADDAGSREGGSHDEGSAEGASSEGGPKQKSGRRRAKKVQAGVGKVVSLSPAAEGLPDATDNTETTGTTETTDNAAETTDTEAAADADPMVDDLFARLRAEQEAEGGAAAEVDTSGKSAAPEDTADTPEAHAKAAEAGAALVDEVPAGAKADEDPDTDLLDLRDATTDELERQLARRLKRVLSDEQNEALDLLRRTRGAPSAEAVLPTEADHLARYTSAALEYLVAAERAGAGFFGTAPARTAKVADVAADFASEMVRQIRVRLERAFADGGDENEVGERIRACYREWKTQRIADTARHYVVVAFSRGVAEAAPKGSSARWLVDDGDAPCPDCDDNALAGPTPKGEPFPTGDYCPPAHPGCRCLAVPVEAG